MIHPKRTWTAVVVALLMPATGALAEDFRKQMFFDVVNKSSHNVSLAVLSGDSFYDLGKAPAGQFRRFRSEEIHGFREFILGAEGQPNLRRNIQLSPGGEPYLQGARMVVEDRHFQTETAPKIKAVSAINGKWAVGDFMAKIKHAYNAKSFSGTFENAETGELYPFAAKLADRLQVGGKWNLLIFEGEDESRRKVGDFQLTPQPQPRDTYRLKGKIGFPDDDDFDRDRNREELIWVPIDLKFQTRAGDTARAFSEWSMIGKIVRGQ